MATVFRPSSLAARKTRMAISERLATRIFEIGTNSTPSEAWLPKQRAERLRMSANRSVPRQDTHHDHDHGRNGNCTPAWQPVSPIMLIEKKPSNVAPAKCP